MTEPKDMIVPMLEEIRAEMTRAFDEVEKRFDGVDKRLDTIDGRQKSIQQCADSRHHDGKIRDRRFRRENW